VPNRHEPESLSRIFLLALITLVIVVSLLQFSEYIQGMM